MPRSRNSSRTKTSFSSSSRPSPRSTPRQPTSSPSTLQPSRSGGVGASAPASAERGSCATSAVTAASSVRPRRSTSPMFSFYQRPKTGLRDTRGTWSAIRPPDICCAPRTSSTRAIATRWTCPARARRASLACALQPRVPQGVRGDASSVPAHTAAGARGSAAPEHRLHGVGGLLHRGPPQRRVVHLELRTGLWVLAHRLPCRLSPGSRPRPNPDLHAARLRPAESSSFGEDSCLRDD